MELPKNAHKEEIMSDGTDYLLKQIMEAMAAGVTKDLFVDSVSAGSVLDRLASDYDAVPSRGCFHEWATYNSGFTEYEYCKKCDKKKDESIIS